MCINVSTHVRSLNTYGPINHTELYPFIIDMGLSKSPSMGNFCCLVFLCPQKASPRVGYDLPMLDQQSRPHRVAATGWVNANHLGGKLIMLHHFLPFLASLSTQLFQYQRCLEQACSAFPRHIFRATLQDSARNRPSRHGALDLNHRSVRRATRRQPR